MLARHLQTQASSLHVTRDCQMFSNSRGVAPRRCNCTMPTPRSPADVTTAQAVPLTVQDVDHSIFPKSLTRPNNGTPHTRCSRRLIEHIQHSLALNVLASPQRFSVHACRSCRFRCRLLLWLLGSLLVDNPALSNCSLSWPTSRVVVMALVAQIVNFSPVKRLSRSIGLVSF